MVNTASVFFSRVQEKLKFIRLHADNTIAMIFYQPSARGRVNPGWLL
jgi:hypothetical protein